MNVKTSEVTDPRQGNNTMSGTKEFDCIKEDCKNELKNEKLHSI